MARKSGNRGAHFDVWPVIADAFLAFLAVVVFMASGRPPLDFEVERLKAQLLEKAKGEFSGLLDEVELQAKWARLVFTEESLSFPKCQWGFPEEKQQQLLSLFRWLGGQRKLLRQIRIEGHADRRWEGAGCNAVGPFQDNLQLSQNRARAIYNVLLGLPPEARTGLGDLLNDRSSAVPAPPGLEYLRELAKLGCLEVAGYGDRHPRDRFDPDSAKNRRVEVVLEFRELTRPMGESATLMACEVTK